MFKTLRTTTLEAIKMLSSYERFLLDDNLNSWFDYPYETDIRTTAEALNDKIWSYDPIATDGGVIAFCIANSLLPADTCHSDATELTVKTSNSHNAGCSPVRGQPTSGWNKLGSAARDRASQRAQNFF